LGGVQPGDLPAAQKRPGPTNLASSAGGGCIASLPTRRSGCVDDAGPLAGRVSLEADNQTRKPGLSIAAHGHLQVTRSVRIGRGDFGGGVACGELRGHVVQAGVVDGFVVAEAGFIGRPVGSKFANCPAYLSFRHKSLIRGNSHCGQNAKNAKNANDND